jgi:hypothetical protein
MSQLELIAVGALIPSLLSIVWFAWLVLRAPIIDE